MNITNEQKKNKAIQIMQKLDIYAPYIRGFREENQVCFLKRSAVSGLIKSPN